MIYEVRVETTVREIWHVLADTQEEAEREWYEGHLVLSEAEDAKVVSMKDITNDDG